MSRHIHPMFHGGQQTRIVYWLLAWSCIFGIKTLSVYQTVLEETTGESAVLQEKKRQVKPKHSPINVQEKDTSPRSKGGAIKELAAILKRGDGSTQILQVHNINGRDAILISPSLSSATSTRSDSSTASATSKTKPSSRVESSKLLAGGGILLSPSPRQLSKETNEETEATYKTSPKGSTIRYIRIQVPELPSGWYSNRVMAVLLAIMCSMVSGGILAKRAMDRAYKWELQTREDTLAYDIAYTTSASELGYGSFVSNWEGDLNKFDI